MKLDETDLKILTLLQKQGRITNSQLAAEAGISPPAMLERVKRLENAGVIEGYTAIINPDKVGCGTTALVWVSLAAHRTASFESFAREIRKLPEVLECHHIAGEEDFVLKVVVRNIQEYEDFVLNKLTPIPGVGKIKTTFILSSLKNSTELPIRRFSGGSDS